MPEVIPLTLDAGFSRKCQGAYISFSIDRRGRENDIVSGGYR